jgi:DNA-binding response OmpR family regulator
LTINLPGLSGSDALLEIKKINNKIPVIACTAYTQNEDAQKLLNQGFDDYIAKPINRNELLNIIKRNVVG